MKATLDPHAIHLNSTAPLRHKCHSIRPIHSGPKSNGTISVYGAMLAALN